MNSIARVVSSTANDLASIQMQDRVDQITRAVVVSKFDRQIRAAKLHAITGNDAANINEACGAIFFVVMYAANTVGFGIDGPDWRIVRGALNVIYELDDGDIPKETDRRPILAGLAAIERLKSCSSQALWRVA